MKAIKYMLVLGAFLGLVCFFGIVGAGVLGWIDSQHAVVGGLVTGAADFFLLMLAGVAAEHEAFGPQKRKER